MNRRKFLKIAGGAGVIVAASAGGFLATRTLSTALEPWQQAGSKYKDPLRSALSYALLAPNPHNRQPWQIELISETEGVLTCDLDRRLPETDPFDRQIVIGLGCFLELFSLAALADGFRANIDLFPEGMPLGDEDGRLDKRPIAHLKLVEDGDLEADPLFDHVFDRRTNRGAYDGSRTISADAKTKISSSTAHAFDASQQGQIGFTSEGPALEALQSLVAAAILVEVENHNTHMESVNLMRLGVGEVDLNPDGISLYGPMLDSLKLVGVLNRDALSDVSSATFKSGLDPMMDATANSPAFVWISTENNDRISQITAGRAYIRTCLAATSQGLSMQPVSQALQEYDDMSDLKDKLHDLLVPNGNRRVQMLARIGYGQAVPASPRWPLSSRIVT